MFKTVSANWPTRITLTRCETEQKEHNRFGDQEYQRWYDPKGQHPKTSLEIINWRWIRVLITFTTKDILWSHSVEPISAVLTLFAYHVIVAVALPILHVTVACSWHSATLRAAAGCTSQRIATAEVVEAVHAPITCSTDNIGLTQALILEQGKQGNISVIVRTEILTIWVTYFR